MWTVQTGVSCFHRSCECEMQMSPSCDLFYSGCWFSALLLGQELRDPHQTSKSSQWLASYWLIIQKALQSDGYVLWAVTEGRDFQQFVCVRDEMQQFSLFLCTFYLLSHLIFSSTSTPLHTPVFHLFYPIHPFFQTFISFQPPPTILHPLSFSSSFKYFLTFCETKQTQSSVNMSLMSCVCVGTVA